MALFRKRVEQPILVTYYENSGKSSTSAFDLYKDVQEMLRELAKDPCINQYIREREPSLDGELPPAPYPAPDTGSPECQLKLAEFTVCEELLWMLRGIVDRDSTEIVQAYKGRHDRGEAPWASDWGFKEAMR